MMEESVEYVLVWRNGVATAVEASTVKSRKRTPKVEEVVIAKTITARKAKLHPMSDKIFELLDLGYKVKDVAKQLNLRYYDVYRVKIHSAEKA